jgi:S-formylglutathione hydrolase FrmB
MGNWREVVVAGAIAGVLGLAWPAAGDVSVGPASPICVARAAPAPIGLRLVDTTPFPGHPRALDLTFVSAALGGVAVHVAVLLPVGYDAHGRTRYPVLYLLHGHGGSYRDWLDHGADAVVGDAPLITVMPEGGYDGWYTDWFGSPLTSPSDIAPGWETFHIDELMPWIDAHYPTVGNRQGRMIAGLSMGGYGAMSYAARHPELFGAAGSFSGAVDLDLDYPVGAIGEGMGSNLPDRRPPDVCVWGDPLTQDVIWQDHDPTPLAGNLHGVAVFVASGNGLPGRYDSASSPDPNAMLTEVGVDQMSRALVAALHGDGMQPATYFYGNGTHTWPYRMDDLRVFLPWARQALAHATAGPPAGAFSYSSADTTFGAWSWRFSITRTVREFCYLDRVAAGGLSVRGSGLLHVITAPLYRPGERYRISSVAGSAIVRADRLGRLRFDIDLGPSHVVQQYDFGAVGQAGFVRRDVVIAPD